MTNETSEQTGEKTESPNKGEKQENRQASGRKSRQLYYESRLKHLQEGLDKEARNVPKPVKKDFTPYTYSNLKPYFDTGVATKIIKTEPTQPKGYLRRETAIGLTDPWVDNKMDRTVSSLEDRDFQQTSSHESAPRTARKEKKSKGSESPRKKEGSTHLPKFPAVSMPSGELTKKHILSFDDVPALREELRKNYSMNADAKTKEEYNRTKQDFYRMDLDRLDMYHPINRPHMRAAYFAYLQNNPGSKQAVYECTRQAEKDLAELNSPRPESENQAQPTQNDDTKDDTNDTTEDTPAKESEDKQ